MGDSYWYRALLFKRVYRQFRRWLNFLRDGALTVRAATITERVGHGHGLRGELLLRARLAPTARSTTVAGFGAEQPERAGRHVGGEHEKQQDRDEQPHGAPQHVEQIETHEQPPQWANGWATFRARHFAASSFARASVFCACPTWNGIHLQ